jgi:hypothetical protein
LLIEAEQQPWSPELDGEVRVSSLQTFGGHCGTFAQGMRIPSEPSLVASSAYDRSDE